MADEPENLQEPSVPWPQFLASTPPPTQREVTGVAEWRPTGHFLTTPDLTLHCDSEACAGPRFFERVTGGGFVREDKWQEFFLFYVCRNCRRTSKMYAVGVMRKGDSNGIAIKYGEWPPYGPPVPARLITLIGPDRDLFLKGRRAENQGLGIGAFAYYRRVVESQKGRLFDEIIRVGKHIGAKPEFIEQLEAAKGETQFTRAVESVKEAIPDILKIDGHNPLTLLHDALSEGLHEHSDEECMAAASAVRIALTELAERMGQALKEHAELKEALGRLFKKKQSKPKRGGTNAE